MSLPDTSLRRGLLSPGLLMSSEPVLGGDDAPSCHPTPSPRLPPPLPDDAFTTNSSPRGRSEWIVEARRGNKLQKRINRCLAERQTDLPTPWPSPTHTHARTHKRTHYSVALLFSFFPWAVLDWYAELGRDAQKKTWPTNDVLCLIHRVGGGGGGRGGGSRGGGGDCR